MMAWKVERNETGWWVCEGWTPVFDFEDPDDNPAIEAHLRLVVWARNLIEVLRIKLAEAR